MDWEILEKEWKALESQQPEESWDRDGLLQVINRKSQHTLQKIRRNVLAEVVMTLLPFAVGIVYFIQNPGTPELFIYLVTAFTLCSASFYLYKYWLLRPSAYISLPTKEALEKSLHIMSLYRTIYIVSSTLFVPLVAGAVKTHDVKTFF
ncbi:MAG: hypothetical protein AAFV78_20965, partial [Bacteroidota bacterium]